MGFWESKLHSEILKSFPQSKEIMSFILSQQDIKCKSNTEFYTSNLWYFSMAQKSFQLFYFSLVDELVEVVQILLIFICIHDGTDRKPHNKLSIWMAGFIFLVYGDLRHTVIIHQCWPAEAGHPMGWTGQPLTTHTGRSHCLNWTICFLGETKNSPECNRNTVFPCRAEGWPPLDSLFTKMSSLFLPSKLKLVYHCDFL